MEENIVSQQSELSAPAEKHSMFATEPIGKLIAKFAIPCVISLVVNALYNIVDQIFIGNSVGYLGNGATNIVFPITIIALALSVLVGDGGAAYFSLKLGAGDKESVKKGVGNSIVMVTVAGILVLVVFLAALKPILMLFGATDTLLPMAMDYGYIIGIGLPFTMISTAVNAIIRVDGSPKYAMLSMLAGAIVNVVFDAVFVPVLGMGVKGAAIATVMGQVVSFVISVAYLFRFKTFKIDASCFRMKGKVCGNILMLGLSSFITQVSITIVMVLFNNLLNRYGAASKYGADIPLTAMGIVMKVNQIMLSILVGIAVGAQPVIGYNYGSKNFHRVKKAFVIAIIAAEAIAVIAFCLFQFAPMSIVSLFGSEEGLYNEFAVMCFRIFLLLCPLNGFQTVAAIYLQAIGKPVKSAIVTLSRQIVFLIPTAVVMPMYIGITGVLWSGPVADGLAFVLALAFILFEMHKLREETVEEDALLAAQASAETQNAPACETSDGQAKEYACNGGNADEASDASKARAEESAALDALTPAAALAHDTATEEAAPTLENNQTGAQK